MVMILGLLSGCGNTESSGDAGDAVPQNEVTDSSKEAGSGTSSGDAFAKAGGNAADTQADDADGTQADAAADDMHEIVLYMPGMVDLSKGLQEVEERVNEISEKEINTHVTINAIDIGNYPQQVSLAMSSGEPIDLMITLPGGPASFDAMLVNNQLAPMTELLEEYCPDVTAVVGDYYAGTTKDGEIYGVTPYRNMASQAYTVMRKDVLEDIGMLEKARAMTSLTEYEEILEAVKTSEKWSHLAPVAASNRNLLTLGGCYLGEDKFSDMTAYDVLGDGYKLISINMDDENAKVVNNYATEDYKKMWQKMVQWNEKGYIYQDYLQAEGASEFVKAGTVFSYFTNGELGQEVFVTTTCGMDMVAVKLMDMPISTGTVRKFNLVIPNTAADPEGAAKFLNLMYTNADVVNTLSWGVEGRDWEVVDGEACYPEGVDGDSVLYHAADFFYGNTSLIYPWQGNGADYRAQVEAVMNDAPLSPYLGFACDTSQIQNEISAISTVVAEFGPSVDCGFASPSDYEAFLNKLEASGASKIIDEYQKQLEAWKSKSSK